MAIEKQTAENNWVVKWFSNLKNTKKNYKKVRASPFASLTFALKIRKLIIAFLLPWLLYMTWNLVANVRANGVTGTIQKVISAAVMFYIMWKIYSTIPAMKKQIEHYKKYPHTINYCPTNTKESVDSILEKIKKNQEQLELKDKPKEAEDKNVIKKETKGNKARSSDKTTTSSSTDK